MDARELDPKIVEAFADHNERLRSLAYVDPAPVEEAATTAIGAASRLLAFEQWHDRLEQRKHDAGSLDRSVEGLAVEAFVRAQEDAQTLASSVIDVVRPFSRAGFFDEAIPYACEALNRVGSEVDMAALFAAARDSMTELLGQRGMDPRLSELLFRAVDEARNGFAGLTLSCHDSEALHMQRNRRRTSMQARNISQLPLLDGDMWVYGGLLRTIESDESAVRDGVPRTSPWGGVLALAKALVESYEYRARMTASEGVHVYATGFAWGVIILIAIIVAVVIGATISLLCLVGVITDGIVCTIGLILLFGGLFMGCVESGGDVDLSAGGGVICTMKFPDGSGFDG